MVESKSVGKTVFSVCNAILLTTISVICILPIINYVLFFGTGSSCPEQGACIMAEKIFTYRIQRSPEIIYSLEWIPAYIDICFGADIAWSAFYINWCICAVKKESEAEKSGDAADHLHYDV